MWQVPENMHNTVLLRCELYANEISDKINCSIAARARRTPARLKQWKIWTQCLTKQWNCGWSEDAFVRRMWIAEKNNVNGIRNFLFRRRELLIHSFMTSFGCAGANGLVRWTRITRCGRRCHWFSKTCAIRKLVWFQCLLGGWTLDTR